jgi:peptidoglycan/LPS O-acetylase OafA/YrhL
MISLGFLVVLLPGGWPAHRFIERPMQGLGRRLIRRYPGVARTATGPGYPPCASFPF